MSITYVDRNEASKILNVSTRTIDRYIRKYKIKIRKKGRKVMIKKNDVDLIIKDHIGHFIEDEKLNSFLSEERSEPKKEEASLAVKDLKIDFVKDKKAEGVYKELYIEVKKELKEKQERLEAATYRVGQLESQLKSMVPILDYSKKEKELKESQTEMTSRKQEWEEALKKSRADLRSERVVKWVYLAIVGTLLVVEPILFILWAFS